LQNTLLFCSLLFNKISPADSR